MNIGFGNHVFQRIRLREVDCEGCKEQPPKIEEEAKNVEPEKKELHCELGKFEPIASNVLSSLLLTMQTGKCHCGCCTNSGKSEDVDSAGGIEAENPKPVKEYDLDYSSIENLDKNVYDLADETDIKDGFHKTHPLDDGMANVDSGAYDDVFAELSNMMPQFKEYVKAQMEEKGLAYNEATVENYIERYITNAVEYAIASGSGRKSIAFMTSGLEEQPTTMKEVINAVMQQIDVELGNEVNDRFKLLKIASKQPFNSTKMAQAKWLNDTADYFLTEDEQNLKFVMEVADNKNSTYGTSDKTQIDKHLNSYSQYIDSFLEEMFELANPSERQAIIRAAKADVMKSLKKDKDGTYSIDDALKALYDKSYSAAQKVAEKYAAGKYTV